jgi:ubiquinone/menaquinone biosynthesis C-methylase UbiE
MIATTNEQTAQTQDTYEQLTVKQPGPLGRMKWALMRGMLSTVGRASNGVRVGYQFGFDSGIMLDYVYINKARGALGFGRLIDRAYLNAVGWRAIRARRALLQQMLLTEIGHNRAANQPTRLLDVAAGPGRYEQEVLRQAGPDRGDVRILCRDLSAENVIQGAKQVEDAGLSGIAFEQGDAFNPAPADAQLGGAPNVSVVSGLYELILEDGTIQQSLARLYQMLAPGGAIYFTTQTSHPQLDFIAHVLPNRNGALWVMKCRPAAQLEEWARAAGFAQITSQAEEVGLFTVTIGRKAL